MDPKDVVERFMKEVFDNHNLDAIDEYVSPSGTDHTPMPGQPEGLEGVRYALNAWLTGFPDGRITIDRMIAEGNTVAVLSTIRGTHGGELMGIPATGKPVTIEGIDIMTVGSDGKMTDHWGYFDTANLLVQLGVIPPMEPQA